MQFLRNKKNIFGVQLNAAEQKAADKEAGKILAEDYRKHEKEIDAMILWRLHNTFKWGHGRLWKFYKDFHQDSKALIARYELGADDEVWVSTQALKEYGIDLEEWEKKLEEENAKSEASETDH